MATLAQLQTALVNADKAGDADAARRLASIISKERARLGNSINIPGSDQYDVPGTVPDKPSESLGQKIKGVGEAALSTVTGAVAMPVAAASGVVGEVLSGGKKDGEEIANNVADAMIYQPRTETGGKILEGVGKVMEPLVALGPMATELGAVGEAAAATRPVVRAAAAEAMSPVKQAATALAEQVKEKISPSPAGRAPTPGTGVSGGAAAVDMADIRQNAANELPVPIKLTEGQKTRAFEQQRFERETAKQGDIGEPIRQRFQEQNLQLQQNMDSFIDSTGAEITDLRGLGEIVDKAIRRRVARDKTKIRALFKEAEKAGEMEERVPMNSVDQLLKDSSSAESLAPVLVAARKELERLGALNYFGRGEGINLKLADTEKLRKFVTKVAGSEKTNIKYASEIKSAIDAATEGKGGEKYKAARAAYAQSMADYENFGLAKQLLKSKRGSTDRAVALEDVLRKSVVSPSASADSIMKLKQLLQTEGPTGQQAWKELQGGTLRHIRDEALKGVGRDTAGNPIVSASALDRVVSQLDKSGKLDLVLGKKQAEQIRTVNEVAKDVLTAPPGAVNTSNTATVLAGLLDVAISGSAGVPVPVATVVRQVTSRIKDAKLRARVKASLGE
jgi:hypothetical protein